MLNEMMLPLPPNIANEETSCADLFEFSAKVPLYRDITMKIVCIKHYLCICSYHQQTLPLELILYIFEMTIQEAEFNYDLKTFAAIARTSHMCYNLCVDQSRYLYFDKHNCRVINKMYRNISINSTKELVQFSKAIKNTGSYRSKDFISSKMQLLLVSFMDPDCVYKDEIEQLLETSKGVTTLMLHIMPWEGLDDFLHYNTLPNILSFHGLASMSTTHLYRNWSYDLPSHYSRPRLQKTFIPNVSRLKLVFSHCDVDISIFKLLDFSNHLDLRLLHLVLHGKNWRGELAHCHYVQRCLRSCTPLLEMMVVEVPENVDTSTILIRGKRAFKVILMPLTKGRATDVFIQATTTLVTQKRKREEYEQSRIAAEGVYEDSEGGESDDSEATDSNDELDMESEDEGMGETDE